MSTAAQVELYVSKRPYIREALAEEIVNYSALARKVKLEKDLESTNAIKAALSRYEDVIAKKREKRKNKVSSILNQTTLEITSNVQVIKEEVNDPKISAKTKNGYTSVVEDGDKALVTLESPIDLENTPGVIEFMLSSIAAEGINVDHIISCREDTHLIVDSQDASQVLEVLQERIRE